MLIKVKEFFWLCSGASIPLIKRCPTDHSKYVGIGATIFFTGLLAALSSSYALYSVFDSIIYAAIFGIVWGLMIFNIDRLIVLSMRKSDRKYSELLQATPRFILAILIAVVISKPLELKIFEKEISSELKTMEQEILKEQENSIQNRYTSKLDSSKLEISSLKFEIDTKRAVRDTLYNIAQKEADGTGGSKRRNPGPIYRIKQKNAQRAQKELEITESKNNELILGIEQRISKIQNEVNQNLQSLNTPDVTGISFKLTALNRLGSKYQTILLSSWFIILLFITIEISPILTKLMSPIGPYDHLLEVREHFYANYKKEKITKSDIALQHSLSKA